MNVVVNSDGCVLRYAQVPQPEASFSAPLLERDAARHSMAS